MWLYTPASVSSAEGHKLSELKEPGAEEGPEPEEPDDCGAEYLRGQAFPEESTKRKQEKAMDWTVDCDALVDHDGVILPMEKLEWDEVSSLGQIRPLSDAILEEKHAALEASPLGARERIHVIAGSPEAVRVPPRPQCC